MVNEDAILNAQTLKKEFKWFTEVLEKRMEAYLKGEDCTEALWAIEPPQYEEEDSCFYLSFLAHYELDFPERIILLLSLIPHIKPQILDKFWLKHPEFDRGYSEFGGIKGHNHGGFIPTGETAMFLLAGEYLELRFSLSHIFDADHFFALHDIVKLESPPSGEPWLSGALTMSREFLDLFTSGRSRKPVFSMDFPAKRLHTELEWSDLVLPYQTTLQVEEIKAWLDYNPVLMDKWNMKKKLKPGFRTLFHGPSGTGKTLTAALLGKYCGLDVYRIDLSMVISKFVGETEKNLSRVFDRAEDKNWILFFDEADALFGKRTKVEDAHDRFANQEVSYLLQRIEEFNGIVILASNLKANMDDAFARRFHSVIYFPLPPAEERLKIWTNAFSSACSLGEDVDLETISEKYELTGGTIMNVVQFASLMALKDQRETICMEDLMQGIRKEYHKEGRNF